MEVREKYLIDVKNAMFWHSDAAEIKIALKELNTQFDSAFHSGIPAEEVIKVYGKPEEVAKKLDGVVRQKDRVTTVKEKLLMAYILGVCVIFALSFSYIFPVQNIALNVLVIAIPALIWFLSGNSYMAGLLSETAENRHDFIKSQAVVLLFALILNLCSFFIMPHMLVTGYMYGSKLLCFIYFLYFAIVLLFVMTVLCLRKMFQGNLYMFFIIAQNISIIIGTLIYIRFLYNIESVEHAQFIISQYFICLAALIPYYIYIKKKKETI